IRPTPTLLTYTPLFRSLFVLAEPRVDRRFGRRRLESLVSFLPKFLLNGAKVGHTGAGGEQDFGQVSAAAHERLATPAQFFVVDRSEEHTSELQSRENLV